MHKLAVLALALCVAASSSFAENPRKVTFVSVSKETFAFVNTRGLVEICPEYSIDDSFNVSLLETFTSESRSAHFDSSGRTFVLVEKGANRPEYALIDRSGRKLAKGEWVTNMIPGLQTLNDGYVGAVGNAGDSLEYRLLDGDLRVVHSVTHARKAAVAEYRTARDVYRLAKGSSLVAFRDENAKWGLIDREGKALLAPSFDGITVIAGMSDRFVGKKGKATGVYAIDGKKIKDLGSGIEVYDSESLIPFKNAAGKMGLLARDFTVAVKPAYAWISGPREGLGDFTKKVGDGELSGYMDEAGKEVIPASYRYANAFSGGYASVRNKDGAYLSIDKMGATVFDFSTVGVSEVGQFGDGYAYARDRKSDRYGFVDAKGSPMPPDPVALSAVTLAARNGVPNADLVLAAMLNPFRFLSWADFSEGLAYVELRQLVFAIGEDKRVLFIVPIF